MRGRTARQKPLRRAQQGAALLLAMLIVTLVATFAASAMWLQWLSVEIETAERSRVQAAWVLNGALDWARLILREDGRNGGPDHLGEPWALPLQEARLSTFLAADRNNNTDDSLDVFLSGRITDQQARLNVNNLVDGATISAPALRVWTRLFDALGVPERELAALAENLRFASDTSKDNGSSAFAPLLPQRVEQLTALGLSAASLQRLMPFITVLPSRTAVNLNTASAQVLVACIQGLDMSAAQRMVTQRRLTPFRSLGDVTQLLNGAAAGRIEDSQHAVASRFFEVEGRLRMHDLLVQEHSLVQRDGLDVKTLWRERMPPTARAFMAASPDENNPSLK